MVVRTVSNPPAALHIEPAVCSLAIEISKKSWIVAVHTPVADKISLYKLKGCDWKGLLEFIKRIR
jgi:transposase